MRCLLAVATAAALIAICAERADAGRKTGWSIEKFDVRVALDASGTIEVTETITARFRSSRHGIYREIPVRYIVGAHHYALRFRLLDVTDEAGRERKTKVSHRDNYVRIRIGDPDRTVLGRNVYRVRYRVQRAVLFEDDHSVLRWNATGNEWRVPIGEASVKVTLPREFDDTEIDYVAWTGRYGSRARDAEASRGDARTILFTTGPLAPGAGISFDLTMPEDAVARPTAIRRAGWWLSDNFAYALFIATLLVCFWTWRRRGRDAPGRGTVVVHYEPPENLGPSEIGTLIDERVDMRDISATIIDFAVRGYLEIQEFEDDDGKTDYRFILKKKPKDLKRYERRIFDKIFDSGDMPKRRLSRLKRNFYSVIPKVKKDLYESLAKKRYFDGNPETVRQKYLWGWCLVVVGVTVLLAILQKILLGRVFPLPLAISGVASIIVVTLFSRVMPRKTGKGRKAWENIAGLEEYITRAEADHIEQQERKSIFERLLPYAIALGIADRWATAFAGIYAQPPAWYQPLGTRAFTTGYLVSSIDSSVDAMNRTLPTGPRSSGGGGSGGGWSGGGFSGGGFSGGGFGGGGGGAW
ncbi:MAG: DUF2207 domain-containing protein [Planctomycetota bacterium]|jgi:uncharacterized membrane protein